MKTASTLLLSFLICTFSLMAQKPVSMYSDIWSNSTWKNSGRSLYSYDANDNMTNWTTQFWDTLTNSYKNNVQLNFINDANGNVLETVSQRWDDNSLSWVNYNKTTHSYNAASQVTELVTEFWNNSAWTNLNKQINTYDQDGYLVSALTLNWDDLSLTYVNSFIITYSNSSTGLNLSYIAQVWDISVNSWRNIHKMETSYNGTNQPIMWISERWSGTTWTNETKRYQTYDVNGHSIYHLNQSWDNASSSFVNNTQVSFTNNPDGSIQQLLIDFWDRPNSVWVNAQRHTYTYLNTSGVAQLEVSDLSIFPNPFENEVNIKGSNETNTRVMLHDIQGRNIYSSSFYGSEQKLDLENVTKGTYIISVEQGDQKSVRKLIKK